MNLRSNVTTLLRNPGMIVPYLRWVAARMARGRAPIIKFGYGSKVGSWANFGEYFRWRHGVEADERRIFAYCLTHAGAGPHIAFDVGANIGQTCLALAAAGYEAVHAFEPIPATYGRLLENLKLNPNFEKIVPNNVGLGAAAGTVEFSYDPASPEQSGPLPGEESGKGICVPVTSLDEYCRSAQIGDIAFLKIDVEGFELDVLKGAFVLLAAGRISAVYTEVISLALQRAGASPNDLFEFLAKFGYRPVDTRVMGTDLVYLTKDEIADRDDMHRNILWLPDSVTKRNP